MTERTHTHTHTHTRSTAHDDMIVMWSVNRNKFRADYIVEIRASIRSTIFHGPACCLKNMKINTGLLKMIVGVFNNSPGHLVLQMQPHVISFYGVTSRIRIMFLLFPQVSRTWRYESEPPLKPSPLTCYKQFGTNLIIVLMFVESQRVHI